MSKVGTRLQTSLYAASVCILSVLVIAYQIALINALAYILYSRFAQLVISLALLGFGTSGSFLAFYRIEKRRQPFIHVSVLFLGLYLALPLCYYTAVSISLDVQYIFFSAAEAAKFLLFIFCFFIPFFLCAVLIGASLSLYRHSVHFIYGANLLGSGIGGIVVLPLMFLVMQQALPFRFTGLALLAFVLWAGGEYFSKRSVFEKIQKLPWIVVVTGIAASVISFTISPKIEPDQYKMISHIRRLEKQGMAQNLWHSHGPRGRLALYSSDTFHDTLFASPLTPYGAPKQYMLLRDGERAGVVFAVENEDEAGILDFTPQSLPYRMFECPRVLIIGETGGTNVLLARRYNARSITVVQQNTTMQFLWKEVLPKYSTSPFFGDDIFLIVKNPRLFLKTSKDSYDIIHIAGREGMPATQSGLYATEEDYLLTVEGIRDCYRLLSESGCISVTMGIQSPPRDNIKITALYKRMLDHAGIVSPEDHFLQGKNYLAATTMVFKNHLTTKQKATYLRAIEALQMDSEWHPGIESAKIEQMNVLPGPAGTNYSYLHHAARRIFSGNEADLYKHYIYNVLPSSDNKPYFNHFFRWSSIDVITKSHGRNWFQSSELGYLLLFASFCLISFLSLLFILIPHAVGRVKEKGTGRYLFIFPVIGLGFMFVEMVLIHKLGIFLGTPVYSIAAVITSLLVFSGIGSMIQGKLSLSPRWIIRLACGGAVLFFTLYFFLFTPFIDFLAPYGTLFRFIAAVLFIAPPAFSLGWFFAGSIKPLAAKHPRVVPFAWGLNGFASVVAAPLATLLSMWIGYNGVLGMALFLYLSAGVGTIAWGGKNKAFSVKPY